MAAPKYQKSVELDLSKKMKVLNLITKRIPFSKISDQFDIAKTPSQVPRNQVRRLLLLGEQINQQQLND